MKEPTSAAAKALLELPAVIAAAVDRGFVARVPPKMTPATQRLFESLGIPVVFDSNAADPDLAKLERGTKKVNRARKKRRRSRRAAPGSNQAKVLAILADGEPHSVAEMKKSVASAGVYLSFLVANGRVERLEQGVYRLTQ